MSRERLLLGWASVIAVAGVNAVSVLAAPQVARGLLAVCAGVALIFAVRGVAVNQHQVGVGLLASLPGVLALLATAYGAWVIGLLATVLLAAAELAAWSWELRGVPPEPVLTGLRLRRTVLLCALGLAASAAVSLAELARFPGGAAAVLVGAAAVAGVAWLVFARRRVDVAETEGPGVERA